jgi:GAF domain-containing protein/two-component sensor histidine kinase
MIKDTPQEPTTAPAPETQETHRSFEQIIIDIATHLINLAPRDIDSGIEYALRLIGEFTQVDRSYVVLIQQQKLKNPYEWLRSPHTANGKEFTRSLSPDTISRIISKLGQFKLMQIPDVTQLPPEVWREREILQQRGIKSFLVAPMAYQGKLVGLLGANTFHHPKEWTEEDVSLLRIVGEMISNALQRKKNEQRAVLAYELGGQLAAILDIDTLLNLTVNQLQDTFGYYHAQAYLLDSFINPASETVSGEQLLLYAGTGDVGSRMKERGHAIPLDAARSIVARAARTKEPVIVADVRQVDYHLPNPALPKTRSEVAIPLVSEQTLIGCLDIQHTDPRHFGENVVRTLEIVAHQLSTALAKARLFTKNQNLVDELSVLQAASLAAAEAQTEDDLLTRITEIIRQAVDASSYGICMVDPDSGMQINHSSYVYQEASLQIRVRGAGEGIIGQVINTGTLKNVPDVTLEPAYIGDPSIRSELCVPIVIHDRVIGTINAESTQIAAFSEADAGVLVTIAGYLATAIEKIRLLQDTRKQAAETAALLATSKAISSLELDHVLNTIVEEAKSLFKADSTRIHLLDADGKSLRCVVDLVDNEEDSALGFSVALGQGITGSVALSGVPEIVNNSLLDRRAIQIPGTPVKPEAMALAALSIRRQVIGVMIMTRWGTERPFYQKDLTLFTAFADQAALAIDNARLFSGKQRQVKEITILNEMATAAARESQEDALLKQAAALVQKALQTTSTGILILDETAGVLKVYSTDSDCPPTLPLKQGIIGRVISTGKGINVPDTTREPAYVAALPGMRSELCLPLRIGKQVIGVINAESDRVNAFSRADERFIKTFARQLTTGLEKTRLLKAEQFRASKQQQVIELGITLLGALSLPELWTAMTAVAQKILNADRTAFYEYDTDADAIICPFAHNLSSEYTQALNQRFRQIPGSDLLRSQRPVVIDDAQTSPAMAAMREYVIREGFHSYAVFQLPATDIPLGALVFYRDQIDPFTAVDQEIGQTLAYIISAAYQNIQLLTEIRHALIREQQLNNITRQLNDAPDLPAILSIVIRNATELIGADAGLVGLVLDNQIMTYYPFNIPVSVNLRPTQRGIGVAWDIVERNDSIISDRYQDHPNAQHRFIKTGVRAFIGVPIVAGDECLGAIKLFSHTPGKTFTRRDLALAESVGRQAGIVIQNQRLYTDLAKRAQALTVALSRQEELDQAKSTFIHNVSHELRTPIGLIYGYAELLNTGGLGPLTADQQNAMSIIVKRVRMLINLLDDLSVLLAAETQEFRRELIDSYNLLNSVVDEFQLTAGQAGISLVAEIAPNLPAIYGDPFHLRRVFDNLLTNAFKFTPDGGQVTVRGWRESTELLIEVVDTGDGISSEEMQRIFERFYQAKAQSTTHHKGKGTGLGLALVREIVEAHRGKVTVRSKPGHGAVFTIRLPGIE